MCSYYIKCYIAHHCTECIVFSVHSYSDHLYWVYYTHDVLSAFLPVWSRFWPRRLDPVLSVLSVDPSSCTVVIAVAVRFLSLSSSLVTRSNMPIFLAPLILGTLGGGLRDGSSTTVPVELIFLPRCPQVSQIDVVSFEELDDDPDEDELLPSISIAARADHGPKVGKSTGFLPIFAHSLRTTTSAAVVSRRPSLAGSSTAFSSGKSNQSKSSTFTGVCRGLPFSSVSPSYPPEEPGERIDPNGD